MGNIVWVPGGAFLMGSDHHYPEEAPAHKVTVDGFWIDQHPVTSAEFARFVRATGHVTVAEQAPDPADYPGAHPELLVPASTVFRAPGRPVGLGDHYQWWTDVPGADWRHPQGPGSSIKKKPDHPVVHVAGPTSRPTPAGRARSCPLRPSGSSRPVVGWTGPSTPGATSSTPTDAGWPTPGRGEFPNENLESDGYAGTSPVGRYPANRYGLLDMIGNVWEWTTDWYQAPRRAGPRLLHGRQLVRRGTCGPAPTRGTRRPSPAGS